MAAPIDLTQDDLRVLRERSSVANSELVIVETADSCNRLPSGCPQTYPSQHLLMNGNKTHLPPPTRPAPPSLPFLPIYPVTYARNGSSPCLFCSPHSSQHQSRFYQVSLSLSLSLPVPVWATESASEMAPCSHLASASPLATLQPVTSVQI